MYLYYRKWCSYPTYEEWKPPRVINAVNTSLSSYPTYEEWKPLYAFYSHHNRFCVLILPMRNGNKEYINLDPLVDEGSYPTYEEWKLV